MTIETKNKDTEQNKGEQNNLNQLTDEIKSQQGTKGETQDLKQAINNYSKEKDNLKIKNDKIEESVKDLGFYKVEGDQITYNMTNVINYLKTISDKSWSDLKDGNRPGRIMAIQIYLQGQGINIGEIDGILGENTKNGVKEFQQKKGITVDGLPGKDTINTILGKKIDNNGNSSEQQNSSNKDSNNQNNSGNNEVGKSQSSDKSENIQQQTNKELFTDGQISVQEVENGAMPYVLIGPKNVSPNEKLPTLFYLHGRGQVGKDLKDLQNHQYDPAVITKKRKLKNFNGYIVCPLLKKGSWNRKDSENQVRNLYNNFSSTHNVDTNRVSVAGASLGGQGALYMANAMSDVFKKATAFSPYNPGNLGNSMKIPTKVYVGSKDDPTSKGFVNNKLSKIVGQNNCNILNGQTHDSTPNAAFCLDSNNNNSSDVLEWLFS